MLIGRCEITDTAIHTHNDSYILRDVSTASARRPFMAPCILIAVMSAGFGASFADLLYIREIITLAAVCIALVLIGSLLRQLQLSSQDLKHSELRNVIFGDYWHVDRLRRDVAERLGDREARHD